MSTLFTLDFFSIVPLLFTIHLAKRHILQNKKNTYYIAAACVTIAILTFEIIANIIVFSNDTHFVAAHKIVNIIGFALSPIVPYLFLLAISNSDSVYTKHKLWVFPLYLNALLCIASYWIGYIFIIDAQNHYLRGNYFFIPTLISLFYIILVVYEILKNRAKVSRFDKTMLELIFLLPIISTIIQIVFPKLLIIWPSVSLSLLLYYIYSLELQYDFDIQCQIKNRSAFEKEMRQHQARKNATLFVFDLNNLKLVNDSCGHSEGDVLIKSAATLLNHCFSQMGEVFRIGGDEFSAICDEFTDEKAEQALVSLKQLLDNFNKNVTNKVEMAHGYAHYDRDATETIYTALSRADDAMYAHKSNLKAALGRRASDH